MCLGMYVAMLEYLLMQSVVRVTILVNDCSFALNI